jgi:hypothetical protein
MCFPYIVPELHDDLSDQAMAWTGLPTAGVQKLDTEEMLGIWLFCELAARSFVLVNC